MTHFKSDHFDKGGSAGTVSLPYDGKFLVDGLEVGPAIRPHPFRAPSMAAR
jgi:hypothetical protein